MKWCSSTMNLILNFNSDTALLYFQKKLNLTAYFHPHYYALHFWKRKYTYKSISSQHLTTSFQFTMLIFPEINIEPETNLIYIVSLTNSYEYITYDLDPYEKRKHKIG